MWTENAVCRRNFSPRQVTELRFELYSVRAKVIVFKINGLFWRLLYPQPRGGSFRNRDGKLRADRHVVFGVSYAN